MTEAEWLAATNPTPMLEFIGDRLSNRKGRLFACACCHRISHLIPARVAEWKGGAERYAEALAISEKYADGLATIEEVREWHIGTGGDYACNAVAVANDLEDWQDALDTVAVWASAAMAEDKESVLIHWQEDSGPASPKQLAAQAVQCQILRDIFGNPFRPVSVDPSWLTSDVVALAVGIYADRAFDRMPYLADALQDAGCDNEHILSHCRGEGPHVRGCWVVDLVLGKE
jgi:hypothetical protein